MKKGIDYTGITVVFFCHDGKGNFVMNHRSDKCRDERDRWDIGGGGLEYGQEVLQAVRDEIKQEYRTDCLKIEHLGYRDVHRIDNDGIKTHWIALDFKVLVDSQKVGNGEPHKFKDVKWFTFDTFPQNCHSQFPKFLDLYRSRL